MMSKQKLIEYYTNKISEYSALYTKVKRDLLMLSVARLLVFLVGLMLSVFLWRVNIYIAVSVLVLAIICFIVLLKKYTQRSFRKSFYKNLLEINRNEIRGLNDDHDCFAGGDQFIESQHDFSHDIDIFGPSSIYQYLNRTCTDRGSEILADWLNSPYRLKDDLMKRQQAIRELAERTQWRQEFAALGMMDTTDKKDIESFNEWLREKPVFKNNRFYQLIRFVLPAVVIILFLLSFIGWVPFSLPAIFFLLNLGFVAIELRKLNSVHSLVSKKHEFLNIIRSLLNHFETASFSSEYLISLQAGLIDRDESAIKSIKELSKIIQAFDNRLNMIAGILLNGLFLWDIHCVVKLEIWKDNAQNHLPIWFENLGEADALISLSNYAWNNTGFVYPEISQGEVFLESENLGHPLIAEQQRVCNNFAIGRAREINIITGANMAGKSTFLRTVTVNLVLAMTGVPVCASRFIFTPCKLFTSMRTADSLSEKESYFYAELKRLKELKDRLENRESIFFVLDEILKGTNSKDKSEGSRLFIEKILNYKATGIIATHDIMLGDLAIPFPQVLNKCFEIEIINDEVRFDYKLRDGITTKMNAALLMKQQGII